MAIDLHLHPPAVKAISWESVTPEEAIELTRSNTEADFLVAFSHVCIREAWLRTKAAEPIVIETQIWFGPSPDVDQFCVDFLITQGATQLVVECDPPGEADYWIVMDVERDQRFRDSGLGLYRFTAEEIGTDAERCAQMAFDYCAARAAL